MVRFADDVESVPRQAEQNGDYIFGEIAVQNQRGATDKGPTVGPGGKLTFDESSYDRIGPNAKDILTKGGVKDISYTPGKGGTDKVEATLSKQLEIPQDPVKDGCNKLILGPKFSADFKKSANGELILDNIKGLQAETSLGIADVTRIKLSRGPNGETQIESTGKMGIFSRTRTRTQPGEVMDKAEAILGRMNDMSKGTDKKSPTIDVPPIFPIKR